MLMFLYIPVSWMFISHIILVAHNETTYENITHKFYIIENPYCRGASKNFLYAIFGTAWPNFEKYCQEKKMLEMRLPSHYIPDKLPLFYNSDHIKSSRRSEFMNENYLLNDMNEIGEDASLKLSYSPPSQVENSVRRSVRISNQLNYLNTLNNDEKSLLMHMK